LLSVNKNQFIFLSFPLILLKEPGWKNWEVLNMPIHEYKCKVCGSITSKLFRDSGVPNSLECMNCGLPAYKIPSRFNIVCRGGYHGDISDISEDVDGIVEMGYELVDTTNGEIIEGGSIAIPIKHRGEKWN